MAERWRRIWRCVKCGYNGGECGLWGADEVCPQCGHLYGSFGRWDPEVGRWVRPLSFRWWKPWTWKWEWEARDAIGRGGILKVVP